MNPEPQVVYVYLKKTEAQARAIKKYLAKPEVRERRRLLAKERYHRIKAGRASDVTVSEPSENLAQN